MPTPALSPFGGAREMNRARGDNILTERLLSCAADSLASHRRRVALLGIAQRSIRVKFKQKKGPFSPHNQLPQSIQSLGDWIKAKRIGKKLTPGHLALKMGIPIRGLPSAVFTVTG